MFLYLKIHNRTFLKHCAMVLQTADSNIADHREREFDIRIKWKYSVSFWL